MIYVAYILLTFLLLRFLVVLSNLLSRPYLKNDKPLKFPKVSVLIPARNEEKTLPKLLKDLSNIDYPDFEIIICDDHSDDKTKKVLKKAMKHIPNLTFFTKDYLPDGWIGKNHACYELAQRASGNYYLYLDSDVRVKPNLLSKLVAYSANKKTSLISVFPMQIIKSVGEWKTVPIMNWILLSFLPLKLTQWKYFSSLSAANGQCMFFDAENYNENQWHEQVKSKNVEDILIAKQMKREKYKIATLLGNKDVACRMYKTYDQGIEGFSRNMHHYFSGNRVWMMLFVLISLLRIPFITYVSIELGAISLGLVLIIKLMVSQLSKTNISKNFLFHIPQLFALIKISIKNLKSSKSIQWKGRVYNQ